MQRRGWQTTEFWLTVVCYVLTALVASGVFAEGSTVAKALAFGMTALAQFGYSISRGNAKANGGG